MKAQDSALLSSSSSSSSSSSHVKKKITASVGCMSAIFHYYNNCLFRPRKFLTVGKKQQKIVTKSSSSSSSPTLPEAEQSKSGQREPLSPPPDKRRKLLEALEKCDEDLKTLTKIIEALNVEREKQNHNHSSHSYFRDLQLQSSPVSVLHRFNTVTQYSKQTRQIFGLGGVIQEQKKKPGGEEIRNPSFITKHETIVEAIRSPDGTSRKSLQLRASKGMVENLNQVCRDIAWGERREIGIIGLALQDYIYRDLIDETVKDLGFSSMFSPLPFETCKRRLRF